MTASARLAIGKRRWWLGGGWDILQFDAATPGWPVAVAWFREKAHADAFANLLNSGALNEREAAT